MARYRLSLRGSVFDTERGRTIDALAPDPAAWAEYQAWLAAGGVPDPIARNPDDLARERTDRRASLERRATDRYLREFNAIGFTWRLDRNERAELVAILAAAQAGEGLPPASGWRDAGGALIALSESQLRNLVGRFTRRDFLIRSTYWARLDQLNSSAEPDAVDVDAGWTD